MNISLDPRARAAADWAAARLETEPDRFQPASTDASFRRYFRLQCAVGSFIVMDAPPEYENCRPFVRVARLMRSAGLHVPIVIASDLERGFLLLSDLGTRTYLQALNAGNADALFDDAIQTLLQWQRATCAGQLPVYRRALLARELQLFPDWYLQHHLGTPLGADEQAVWQAQCERLIEAALAQPQVFVHRDYMPRNLMLSQPNPGVLDFQDAVIGPLAYDVISLFKDAFLSWPAERVEGWLSAYWHRAGAAGLPVPGYARFRRDADWIGVQRHLKVLGIFARLAYRDGKPDYLSDTPRFVRYVTEVASRYPELAALSGLFDKLVLPVVSP
ncbi:MAG: phosphotransferase [Gammaproteobacteria bacterium]|nr:phosphotransferase [Gammaproteobacteria bacterium]